MHEKGKDNTERTFVQLKKLGVDSKSLSLRKNLVHMTTKSHGTPTFLSQVENKSLSLRKNLVHMTTASHKTPTRLSQVENLSAYGDKMILMGYASAS